MNVDIYIAQYAGWVTTLTKNNTKKDTETDLKLTDGIIGLGRRPRHRPSSQASPPDEKIEQPTLGVPFLVLEHTLQVDPGVSMGPSQYSGGPHWYFAVRHQLGDASRPGSALGILTRHPRQHWWTIGSHRPESKHHLKAYKCSLY